MPAFPYHYQSIYKGFHLQSLGVHATRRERNIVYTQGGGRPSSETAAEDGGAELAASLGCTGTVERKRLNFKHANGTRARANVWSER